jgi:hypothetical protein
VPYIVLFVPGRRCVASAARSTCAFPLGEARYLISRSRIWPGVGSVCCTIRQALPGVGGRKPHHCIWWSVALWSLEAAGSGCSSPSHGYCTLLCRSGCARVTPAVDTCGRLPNCLLSVIPSCSCFPREGKFLLLKLGSGVLLWLIVVVVSTAPSSAPQGSVSLGVASRLPYATLHLAQVACGYP